MATAAHSIKSEERLSAQSPEQALCNLFDIVEDALEKLPAEKRTAWLKDLSETAERLEKQA